MNRTHIPTRLPLLLGLLVVARVPVAQAQLYAREAPPGAAFIHVFNATPNTGVTGQIDDKSLPPLLPYSASEYVFLTPGEHSVQVAGVKQPFKLDGGHFYTVAAESGGLQLFEFHEPLTKLKAMIAVFNLLPATTLSLKTADGATAVFDSVAPHTNMQRTINPLKLNLALFDGTRKIVDVPEIRPERGQSFSLFVSGTDALPVLVVNKD